MIKLIICSTKRQLHLNFALTGLCFSGLKGSGVPLSIIIGIIAIRYIFLPLSGILIVKGAIHFGLVHSDPLYQFVLLVQFAVPPAMNIGTIRSTIYLV